MAVLKTPAKSADPASRARGAAAAGRPWAETETRQEGLIQVAAGRAGMLLCRPTAAYHRREDVAFVPVEGVPESALGLVWHRDGESAGVRAFAQTLAGRGVSLADPRVVA